MKQNDFQTMSMDDLWALYEKVGSLLTNKLESERCVLQGRLDKLTRTSAPAVKQDRPRRPYPKVIQKFHNPTKPAQTWSGRGLQPRWVIEMLEAGRSLDDLLISERA